MLELKVHVSGGLIVKVWVAIGAQWEFVRDGVSEAKLAAGNLKSVVFGKNYRFSLPTFLAL